MNYSSIVIDHFERPRNVIADCQPTALNGRAGSFASGMMVEFCLERDHDKISHASFRAWGCPHTIAVASWLTENIAGKKLDDVRSLDLDSIAGQLQLPPEKWGCILVAEDALRAAIGEVTDD